MTLSLGEYRNLIATFTLMVALLTLWVMLGGTQTAQIYVTTTTGEQAPLGPAIAAALNSGGLAGLAQEGFPRATTINIESWALEVDGNWTFMSLDWQRYTATLTGPISSPSVEIRTNQAIAQELYDLATGQGFDPGIMGWWTWGLTTGVFVNGQPAVYHQGGYKGAVESWAFARL